MESYRDKTAIVGIGVVALFNDIGRTEWYTACQAIKLAVDDAGLDMKQIDCLVKNVDDGPDQMYIQKGLGMDNLTYAAESHWGTSPMMNAITAVASGRLTMRFTIKQPIEPRVRRNRSQTSAWPGRCERTRSISFGPISIHRSD